MPGVFPDIVGCFGDSADQEPRSGAELIERSRNTRRGRKVDRVGTRDNDVWLRHVEPARVPLGHAAPSSPQIPDSLHRLAG